MASTSRLRLILWGMALAALAGTLLYAIRDFDVAFVGRDYRDLFDRMFDAVIFLAAAACLVRALLVRADRGVWLAIAASVTLWGVAEVYWELAIQGNKNQPYPSLSDGLWIASYVPFYIGLVLFVRSRLANRSTAMWLDGLVAATACLAVGTAILAPALVSATEGDPAAVATNLAYPIGDMLLLALVVFAAVLVGTRAAAQLAAVAAALVVLAIADSTYLYLVATGSYGGASIDWLWPLSFSLLAVGAAWRPDSGVKRTTSYQSLLVPFASWVAALSVLVLGIFRPVSDLAEGLAAFALAVALMRLILTLSENRSLLRLVHLDSVTDALTGLANRRQLLTDLNALFRANPGAGGGGVFAMFDLDGFKNYNDAFGHPAGDLLLRRLGGRLSSAVAPNGTAYRLGGDEFCVLAAKSGSSETLAAASRALSERGDGFSIASSSGVAMLPDEASDPSAALRLADTRMYEHKRSRGHSEALQARNVLISALNESEPELGRHQISVATIAAHVGSAMGVTGEELDVLIRAAELHDIGKLAIPDEILHKPGPLSGDEWELLRTQTMIGERILASATAMTPVARLVRSSHERWDGTGYPDGLRGAEIPLGARIIFACDAFEAMTSELPHSPQMSAEQAFAELRRDSGTRFDPDVIANVVSAVRELSSTTVDPGLAKAVVSHASPERDRVTDPE